MIYNLKSYSIREITKLKFPRKFILIGHNKNLACIIHKYEELTMGKNNDARKWYATFDVLNYDWMYSMFKKDKHNCYFTKIY